MEMEYDSSELDSVIASNPDIAFDKFKRQMDEKGQTYTGIVITESFSMESSAMNLYICKAINIESVE